MREIVVDEKGDIQAVDGRRRIAECSRCGECCRQNRPTCPHFLDEKPAPRCNLEGANKPWSCKLWPLPDSPDVPAGCTVRYEEG